MKCYLLSSDLMFSSQVNMAAKSAGVELQTIGEVASIEDPSLVIVDLTTPGLDISATIAVLNAKDACVIAVGPHVQEERLAAATQAGARRVLTKGQAHRDLASVLRELL